MVNKISVNKNILNKKGEYSMKKIVSLVSLLCITLVSFFLQAAPGAKNKDKGVRAVRCIEHHIARHGGVRLGDSAYPVARIGMESGTDMQDKQLLYSLLQRVLVLEEKIRALKRNK